MKTITNKTTLAKLYKICLYLDKTTHCLPDRKPSKLINEVFYGFTPLTDIKEQLDNQYLR